MSIDEMLSMPQEKLEELVYKKLEYLVAEGVVLQVGNKFRLKTQKELDGELNALLAE